MKNLENLPTNEDLEEMEKRITRLEEIFSKGEYKKAK